MMCVAESKEVLEKIESQIERLNMMSHDVAALADINHVTFLNNFKKVKTPKFNDIYRISLAIGMSADQLLYTDSIAPENDPRNIFYWYKNEEKPIDRSSFIAAIPDKIAVADLLCSLNERYQIAGKEMDLTRFQLIRNMMLLQEADFIFLYNIIASKMYYYCNQEPLYVERDNLYDIWSSMRGLYESVWDPKTAITHLYWDTVTKKMHEVFSTRTKFIRASGVSTQACNEYNDKNGISSPTTETMLKVADLLSIDSIDAAIRDNIEDIKDPDNISKMYEEPDTPYKITYSEIRNHMKTMPKLGIFLDQVLSLNDFDIKYFRDLVGDMIKHPFNSYSYLDPKLREE